jgi:glucosamine--fructose-6-phosphate aminotransferase (isomerizing)
MNMEKNYHTLTEIKSQTNAWAQALDLARAASLPDAADYDQVIFTGCGSTYYLSLALPASLYQELTSAPRAVPAGELLLNPQTTMIRNGTSNYLLIAISRSGTTTETVKAVERLKTEQDAQVAVITNYDQTLSRLADVNLVISEGQEESVAQTRSFASMYVAACAICARMAGRDDLLSGMSRLPAAGQRLMESYDYFARQIGESLEFDRFYFLGSGIRYGLACETNLKMKEMTLTHSEPFHFLEFRHGPMSMVNRNPVVWGCSRYKPGIRAKVLSEMKRSGDRGGLRRIRCGRSLPVGSPRKRPGRAISPGAAIDGIPSFSGERT